MRQYDTFELTFQGAEPEGSQVSVPEFPETGRMYGLSVFPKPGMGTPGDLK